MVTKRLAPEWGKQCKVQMIQLGKSLREVGFETGYTHTYVSAIINGRTIAPNETVEKISKALDVDPALYQ